MYVESEALVPNSFSLKSKAKFLAHLKSKTDFAKALTLSKEAGLPILAIGSGTNVILGDHLESVVALMETKGITKTEDLLKVEAGEDWDGVVEFAVNQKLSGLEALSLIPGKAGSAPIQNIGAYGAEIGDSIVSVEAYDTLEKDFVVINKKDCDFRYRDSLFKRNPGRFIIASIVLQLSKDLPSIPDYKDVKNYFAQKENLKPTLQEIRRAIIEIRQSKLPDYRTLPNCGSFFKNPIVENELAQKIKLEFPDLPIYTPNFPTSDVGRSQTSNKVKIPAGFLIEKAGLKGANIDNVVVYERNALVLTNPFGASFANLLSAKNHIQKTIFQKFGVTLEPEVNIIT